MQFLTKSKSDMRRRGKDVRRLGRLRIPKRGRIRFFLFLIVVFVGVGHITRHQDSLLFGSPAFQAQSDSLLQKSDVAQLLKPCPVDPSLGLDTVIYRGDSLLVHYSVDSALQAFGQSFLEQHHPQYGAVVALEPGSGRVICLVDYTHCSADSLGPHLYCRNFYPAASVFKTVTAVAALDMNKLMPESCLKQAGSNHTLYRFQLKKKLRYYDEISLTDAFAYSNNPVFGRVGLYVVGLGNLNKYAEHFGFGCAIPFELATDTSLAMQCDSEFSIAELASGFNEQTVLTPLLGAVIAAGVANESGAMPTPFIVDSLISLKHNRMRYRAVPVQWKTPMQSKTNTQLRHLMKEVVRFGTAHKSFRYVRKSYRFQNAEYGGKTGSVNRQELGRVDWFIGFARDPERPHRDLAVAVVTVHGEFWTVHSSFVGAEILRQHFKNMEEREKGAEQVALAEK